MVDNVFIDNFVDGLEVLGGKVVVICLKDNFGYIGGNNLGMEYVLV